MVTRFITANDGIQIAYDLQGRGPALMLLNEAGKSRKAWHKAGYVDRLQRNFAVITVDLRGTGESGFLTDIMDYSIDKVSRDLYAVADACQAERFLIWGYSFGGTIARYFGAFSNRTSAVAVVGDFFGPVVDARFSKLIDESLEKWEPSAGSQKGGDPMEKEKKTVNKNRIPVWAACFQAMRSWPNIIPDQMRCPTLLVVGTRHKEAMKWVNAHHAEAKSPKLQVEIIEGLNHSQEFSEIERVFPVVDSFLTSHSAI